MVTELQQQQAFGANIVCEQCGVPLPPSKFDGDSIVCQPCMKQLAKRQEVLITPEDAQQNRISQKLEELRKTSDPSVINGYDKAEDILGCSPQEIAAEILMEMRDPGRGRSDLTEEQRAALPKDYKTMKGYTDILQKAQFKRDEQLIGTDPFESASPEQLRATILKGVLDHAHDDRSLRMQLIRGFAARCDTFFDEVMEVAKEVEQRRVAV